MIRWLFASSILLFVVSGLAFGEEGVDFNRDIRPILSDRCYACHGPDEDAREGGFRLDVKDSAFGEADSGESPIVAGDTETSELLVRITSDDESMVMPPADSNKSLVKEEIEKIRQWIESGAPWREHWAFIPPEYPELPPVSDEGWCREDFDRFVLGRLEKEGLKPSPEADKLTLMRRVTLDLTGLPPTLEEVDAFLADKSSAAYERLVDRLLESPRYGEHMARFWLDSARYGDTHGLHLDNYREMWPYRDWVVRAFNRNLAYDQFTIEQLAGDLLPEPTLDQLVATGFNRCHVTTNEGGSIKEEVYVRNVVDRVVTTSAVFMGLTFDCTRCHDHKYDPFTMKDFYAMFAFFNSLDGNPMDGNKAQHPPVIKVPTDEQLAQEQQYRERITATQQKIDDTLAKVEYDDSVDLDVAEDPEWKEYVWIDDAIPAGAKSSAEGQADGQWTFVGAPQPVYSGDKASTRTAEGRSQHFFENAPQGLRVGKDDKLFAYVYLDPENTPQEIMLQWNTGSWKHRAYWGENAIDWGKDSSNERRPMGELPSAGEWARLEVDAAHVGIQPGTIITGWAFTQFGGTVYWDKAGIVTATPQANEPFDTLTDWVRAQKAMGGKALPHPIDEIVKLERDKRSDEQQQQLVNHFLQHAYAGTREVFDPLLKELNAAEKQLEELDKKLPTTLVFRELREPRSAYLLNRGEYDQQKDEVQRAVPAILPPLPEGVSKDRLGLARWLVDPAHPLTARVAVNRFWLQLFGTGIVKTAEDFGSQGEPPTHPLLLDQLSVQFRDDGWDVKRLMKRLVMSATYRQSSRVTPELVQRDPYNRLLARGPRFRLDAEMLRDQALALGGLLVADLGGPSVKPPQPDGLWFSVGYSGSNTVRFVADKDKNKVHRRTLYTFFKRTSPPPQMSTFDAPSRESFCVRRERTNTPLQALLLMNDPQYFEAAQALAGRVYCEGGDGIEAQAKFMYRLCTCRPADDMVTRELIAAFGDHHDYYRHNLDAAREVIGSDSADARDEAELCDRAAWTLVANLVLNLDLVLTKN